MPTRQRHVYRTLSVVFVMTGLLGMASSSWAQWTQKADMPTARAFLGTSVVNGKIYAIGGAARDGSDVGPGLSTVEEYDPATDTWTTKADMPTPRTVLSTSVVNGKIYAIGGIPQFPGTALSTVEAYDPATDTWTTKADMPTPRTSFPTSVVNGKIYAIGGSTKLPVPPSLSTVEAYDPATDTWTQKADMPTARALLSANVVDDKIYAIGGASDQALSTVEAYNPATDTWEAGSDMPAPRWWFSTSAVNRFIYAIGGLTEGWPSDPVSTVEEYDPSMDPGPGPQSIESLFWGEIKAMFR